MYANNNNLPSAKYYETKNATTTLDVTWGQRTTAPGFYEPGSNGNGLLDEGINKSIGITDSTIFYNNYNYILEYAQINAPTQQSFALDSNYNAEMTLYFSLSDSSTAGTKAILIIIPLISIINGSPATDPSYLQALATDHNSGITGLYTCLPNYDDNYWIYYSTCIPDQGNILVFTSLYGTRVSDMTLGAISSKVTFNMSGTAPLPGLFKSPILYGVTSSPAKHFSTSWQSITRKGMPGYEPISVASTDEYKCVQFDPAKNVIDGSIQINVDSGKMLTRELAERKEELSKIASSSSILSSIPVTPKHIEKFFANALGILLAILTGFVIFYIALRMFSGKAVTEDVVSPWVKDFPYILLVATICGFIGFIAGSLL